MTSAFAGIGLKSCHFAEIMETRPSLGFLEIHAENYMSAGGPSHTWLRALTQHYPLSIHGVGLSLGSTGPLNGDHLDALAQLVDRYNPLLVSEHLAWSRSGDAYLNDLLPIPYTQATLSLVADHVEQTQDRLGRTLLIENPSAYIGFRESEIPEPEFLALLAHRTGCRILLDLNNIYVSARNLGTDPHAYLEALPEGLIGQYHLAGHHIRQMSDRTVLIDNHGAPVCPDVWGLFAEAVDRFGVHPTTVEWDCDIPDLAVLLAETEKAQRVAGKNRSGQKGSGQKRSSHALAS